MSGNAYITDPRDHNTADISSSGALRVNEEAPSTLLNGKKTVTTAGTRVALASTAAVRSVVVRALLANTGKIFVGDSSVSSTNGIELNPGDALTIHIDDLAKVYLDSAVNGEGVTYIAS